MRIIKLGNLIKTTVKLYQDIDETPIELYNLFNEYALRDAEVGNTMEDIDRRYNTLATLIGSNQPDKAIQELANLYQTHWSMFNKLNYKGLQFACLVHSIDDVEVKDFSEDNLNEVMAKLSRKGLTMAIVKEVILDSKKNSKHN